MTDPNHTRRVPCECGFYDRERHHSRTGGGRCVDYEFRQKEKADHTRLVAEALGWKQGEYRLYSGSQNTHKGWVRGTQLNPGCPDYRTHPDGLREMLAWMKKHVHAWNLDSADCFQWWDIGDDPVEHAVCATDPQTAVFNAMCEVLKDGQ